MFKSLVDVLSSRFDHQSMFHGLDPRVNFNPWNPTLAEWPLARVICRTTQEVSDAIRIAADFGTPVTAAAGREGAYARNSRSGHIVLDLRHLNGATLDARQEVVAVGGGTTTKAMLDAIPSHIVTPTVTNAGVGVVGAASGGGYGLLCGSFGLACDALVHAEVVLADGSVVTASNQENTELFWALRGGGTGFGVVTQARFATHTCFPLWSGSFSVPLDSAVEALLLVQDLLDKHPHNLGVLPLFIRQADAPVLMLPALWNGPAGGWQRVAAALSALDGAEAEGGGEVAYRATIEDGAIWPWGKNWAFDTRTIERLTSELARRLADAASDMPLPGTILFLHDFHGRAAQIEEDETAFALRRSHFVAMATARWEAGNEDHANLSRSWVRRVADSISPFAMEGGYVNFLHPSETNRVRQFYGAAADRLSTLKAKLDPYDVFRSATARLNQV